MSEEEVKELEGTQSFVRVREYISNESVGIDSVPHQLVKKRIQDGFTFNILLIGETGIGKTTLACSLFNIHQKLSTNNDMYSKVTLKSNAYDLHEKEVNVKLSIVETIGYGDAIDRKDSVEPINKYIESQFEMYFTEESKAKRSTWHDTRIHACLYFICPTGHSLKSIDLFCMKQLHDKVNLIPIVARADSLSKEELQSFKSSIKSTIENYGIKIYRFPTGEEEISDFNSKANELVPFAVAASEDYVSVKNKLMRARIFPWGTMIVENEEHSEFPILRRALIETNMVDMVEKTSEYYEKYRRMRLSQYIETESGSENKPVTFQELIQNQRSKRHQEMLEKEQQLRERYIEKLKAKETEFKIQENALCSKYKKMFDQLKEEEENIQYSKNKLELEILDFKKRMGVECKTT